MGLTEMMKDTVFEFITLEHQDELPHYSTLAREYNRRIRLLEQALRYHNPKRIWYVYRYSEARKALRLGSPHLIIVQNLNESLDLLTINYQHWDEPFGRKEAEFLASMVVCVWGERAEEGVVCTTGDILGHHLAINDSPDTNQGTIR